MRPARPAARSLLLVLAVGCGGTPPPVAPPPADGAAATPPASAAPSRSAAPSPSVPPVVAPPSAGGGAASGDPGASNGPAQSAVASSPAATRGPAATDAPASPSSMPASPSPTVAVSAAPGSASPSGSADPPDAVAHDSRKFGFAAKGMSNEVMAFVTVDQLDYAIETMNWDVVSTVAYFSLEATGDGTIARDAGWNAWNSDRMERLIETAHRHGSRVVISLERFAWSAGQTAAAKRLLANKTRRDRLARDVAREVARRGADGVNIDFEPIPPGQKDEFTDFVRVVRRELDRVAPGLQLTFCVVGHHESYDVGAATGPDAADAVYLMGYHYAGNWSSRAGSTAPMGGPGYDLVETVDSLLREVEPNELIVGVPYYGHTWPTAGDKLNARTQGGGSDVPFERAIRLAERYGSRYDKREQVAWVPYRARPCDGCAERWYQLYFDDARAARHKWTWIEQSDLLGTGVWTIGFEGRPGPLDAVMRDVFLEAPEE